MFDAEQMLQGFQPPEQEEYDDEAMESALYGEATQILLAKAKKRKDMSLRLQDQNKQRNRQAMQQSERLGV
jgi:hypothetical protein